MTNALFNSIVTDLPGNIQDLLKFIKHDKGLDSMELSNALAMIVNREEFMANIPCEFDMDKIKEYVQNMYCGNSSLVDAIIISTNTISGSISVRYKYTVTRYYKKDDIKFNGNSVSEKSEDYPVERIIPYTKTIDIPYVNYEGNFEGFVIN